MAFAPKAGCPMCGIVSTALHSQISSSTFQSAPNSSSSSNKPDILWRDENFTIYKEKVNPVSSKAHIIIAFKSVLGYCFSHNSSIHSLHVPSIYTLVRAQRLRIFASLKRLPIVVNRSTTAYQYQGLGETDSSSIPPAP
jgi:hypothetical protein